MRGWHQWEGGGDEKRGRRMNTLQIMCTNVGKCKNDTFSRNLRRRDEGEWCRW
jgi:hypothetical protein